LTPGEIPHHDAQHIFDRTGETDRGAYEFADGGGLFLLIQPSGGKLWRLRRFYLGKERTLSVGAFPAVGLADARERREPAKKRSPLKKRGGK
jgi:hypothetical protein